MPPPNESYFIGTKDGKVEELFVINFGLKPLGLNIYKFCNWFGALCIVIFVRPIMNLSIF